jgi:Flp pilus assembly secretin CpaC
VLKPAAEATKAPAKKTEEVAAFEPVKEAGTLKLAMGRPTLLRMKGNVYRAMVADSSVCDVVRITARDISLSGRAAGQTHVTFFYEDQTVPQLTYLVEVAASEP